MRIVLLLVQFVRYGILFPLVMICWPFSKWLRERVSFERKNLTSTQSIPWGYQDKPSFCFEVSSEGEFEQALPFIEAFIAKGSKLEIVYSSPSVEKKIEAFADCYKDFVRTLRLPLLIAIPRWIGGKNGLGGLGQNFENWSKAPTLILVRYDFYPELLLSLKQKKGVLIEASLIGKERSSLKLNVLKRIFNQFLLVVPPTYQDQSRINQLTGRSPEYVFEPRVLRVLDRLKSADKKLQAHPILWQALEDLKGYPRLMMGSVWGHDLGAFENPEFREFIRDHGLKVWLAPHKLGQDFIQGLKEQIEASGLSVSLFSVNDKTVPTSSVVILTSPGILCELYHYFPCAYVGGGFGRSIHSVLEPFVADAAVLCGPKVYRSTEFEMFSQSHPDLILSIKEWDYKAMSFIKKHTPGHSQSRVEQEVQRQLNVFEQVKEKLWSL